MINLTGWNLKNNRQDVCDQVSGFGCQVSGFRVQGVRGKMKLKIKNYQDLEVWQKAMDLVVICYQMTSEIGKMLNGLRRSIEKKN
jgi:hypothetical protein